MQKWKPEINRKKCTSCLRCVRMLSYVSLADGKPEVDEGKFFLLANGNEKALYEISMMVKKCCTEAAFEVNE